MRMRVLITGHTGFKGSWLAIYLKKKGFEIHGLALEAEERSLFNDLQLAEILESHQLVDIRDAEKVKQKVSEVKPDVIIHLAAQALVLEGYRKPLETFEVNIGGTINIALAAIQSQVPNILIITTDKVYKTGIHDRRLTETDELGGSDPYSQSKVIADLSTQSFMQYSQETIISIARGGNVIGGGDYGSNRLIPDLFHALQSGNPVDVRFPEATRPWQHVLDCISGYWKIVEHSFQQGKGDIWNIGPAENSQVKVESVCSEFEKFFTKDELWRFSHSSFPENLKLQLDSSKALTSLGWAPKLSIDRALYWTFSWYAEKLRGSGMRGVTEDQIEEYMNL